MLWVLNERRKVDDPDSEPVEAPTSDRVMRNFARVPAAALGRAN